MKASMRKYLNNLRQNNPELFSTKTIISDPDHQKDIAESYKIGDRCEVKESGHRGTVKYIGRIPDLSEGFYVGVQLDEPYGVCAGAIKGVNYFTCEKNYGLIVRPSKIKVGDYPEIDEFADEDEIDEI